MDQDRGLWQAMNERLALTPGSERRATSKLLAFWEILRKDAAFPSLSVIHPADFDDIWPDCFLFEVVEERGQVSFLPVYRGPRVRDMFWGYLEPDSLIALQRKQEELARTLLTNHTPQVDEAVLPTKDGRELRYRQAMVPLGTGGVVDHVMGVVRYTFV